MEIEVSRHVIKTGRSRQTDVRAALKTRLLTQRSPPPPTGWGGLDPEADGRWQWWTNRMTSAEVHFYISHPVAEPSKAHKSTVKPPPPPPPALHVQLELTCLDDIQINTTWDQGLLCWMQRSRDKFTWNCLGDIFFCREAAMLITSLRWITLIFFVPAFPLASNPDFSFPITQIQLSSKSPATFHSDNIIYRSNVEHKDQLKVLNKKKQECKFSSMCILILTATWRA